MTMTYGPRRATHAAVMAAAVFAAAAGLAPVASAQELEEIVVTARRVEEKLKDVPLAITAFDSRAIEAANITSLGDVAALTPGLSFFNAFGENLPVPVIRGIVPQDIFGDNAAAIFIDGVYVSGREGLNFSQLDVDQITVLKGPQSAMYGRNAFSGAINYITKPPSDVFESRAEVEGGTRGRQKMLGVVSGPVLGDTVTGRFSALYDEWDGSYDNSLAPENDIGGHRYRSLQGKLRWRPSEALDVNLGVYLSNDEIDESAVGGLPANCEDRLELTAEAATNQPFTRMQNYCGRVPDLERLPDMLDANAYPGIVPIPDSVTHDRMPKIPEALGEDRDLLRTNLNIIWDLDFGTFSFLTGYSDLEQNSASDFGRSVGNGMPLIYCPTATTAGGLPTCMPPYDWARVPMGFVNQENGSTVEEVSQEIRFTSPRDQRLRYMTGFYYYDVELEAFSGAPIATMPPPPGYPNVGIGPAAYPTSLAIGSYIFGPSLTPDGGMDPLDRPILKDKTEAWSVFGAVDYDLTDALEAHAELRYSHERLENADYTYTRCARDFDGDGDIDEDDSSTFPYNDPPVDDCGDDYYDLRAVAPSVIDSGSERFPTLTGRVGLKYKFESGWMLFGSVARGEKPGGLQILSPNVVTDTGVVSELLVNPFDPEKLTTYEIGLKGYTSDRRLSVDMTMFYSDWSDIVLRQLIETSPVSGRQFEQPTGLNVNAGDARVWGWEMQADLAFTDELTGRFTVGYTDSQLKDARMDTFALFPSFYTDDPTCAPAAIQALPDPDPGTGDNEAQIEKSGQCRTISGDVSGNTQMRQPEWTSSASLTYRRQLAGDWDWFTRADASYTGKIYTGNDNQSWLPARTTVNLRLGFDSPRYSVEFWVRNLLEDDNPIAAFRDIYWANDDDIQGLQNPALIQDISNFDDFPPLRMSVSYPSLRTFGVIAKMRFGAA
ncbi:MAG: TonB-dependent receptor, partial [Gammaproteobacteria bacterium]|nr:TonB-dependent receptor [Gammaproteobacteria bacterium]